MIEWRDAVDDVRRFLRPVELQSTELWSARVFHAKLDKLLSFGR